MADDNQYEDLLVERDGPLLIVTINRPDRFNAFRGQTVDELIRAFKYAWSEPYVRVVILTGAGQKAFCAGGDVKQRAETGDYGPTELGMLQIDAFHRLIRDIPKPVVAAVNGAAIGGGHVIHVLCDLSIASTTARFGQAGPRVGSFDAGFGSTYLARVVGEKRAREIWFLCREYTAEQAERWGLVNYVYSPETLMDEAKSIGREIARLSPTALKFLKRGFNSDTEHQAGSAWLAMAGLDLFVHSDEAQEGVRSFVEKRAPDFTNYPAPV
jgi:naphthoate synthase